MVYVVVITALLVIDLLSGDDWWFYWPMIGWGIGVAIHAGITFLGGGRFGREWEERKIREYMERDRGPGGD